jgi:hypothetical protein
MEYRVDKLLSSLPLTSSKDGICAVKLVCLISEKDTTGAAHHGGYMATDDFILASRYGHPSDGEFSASRHAIKRNLSSSLIVVALFNGIPKIRKLS